MIDSREWVVSPAPFPTDELPWVTTAESVHRFNALYSSHYGANRQAIPLPEYLENIDETERRRVMEIVEWQPPEQGD